METKKASGPRLLVVLIPVLISLLFWLLGDTPLPTAQAERLLLAFQSPLDLGIVKSVTPDGPLTVGDPITYTVAYFNAGPNLAPGVVITDVLPATLTGIGFASSGARITPTGSLSYTWLVEPLAPGGWGVITITATVDPAFNFYHALTNTATITTTEVDTDTQNNLATVVTAVYPRLLTRPRLIHPPNGAVTNSTALTFTWSDESTNGAYGYTFLLDSVPYTLSTPYSATVLADGTYPWTARALDWQGNSTGYTDTWTVTVDRVAPWIVATSPYSGQVDVGVNAPVVITFSEAIDPASLAYAAAPDPGGWAASWNVTGTVVTLDHDSFACSVDHAFTVLAAADRATNALRDTPATWPFATEACQVDLVITKDVTPGSPLNPGDAIIYSIDYANSGPEIAYGVVITDVVPITLTDVGFTASGAQITPTGSVSFTWLVEDLSPGEGGVIVVTALIDPAVNEEYFLTNTISIVTSEADQNLGNNQATVVSKVYPNLLTRPRLIHPPNGTITNTPSITFTWSDETENGAYGYTFLLDETPYPTTAPSATAVLSDGLYTWTARALDWQGNSTGYTDTWSLEIDTVPPQVLAMSPVSGAVEVPLNAAVVVTFSEAIDPTSLVYTVTPDPGGWSVDWNGAGTVLTMAHSPFAAWSTYTVSIVAADWATNMLLDAPVEWPFTTRIARLYVPLILRDYGNYTLMLPIIAWSTPSH
ncbi:MAG: DUF11 domain-containing protein [Anaerolineae bacterium]|nr:DUF11 domain-containing protein [Anaerolineae bacterium]